MEKNSSFFKKSSLFLLLVLTLSSLTPSRTQASSQEGFDFKEYAITGFKGGCFTLAFFAVWLQFVETNPEKRMTWEEFKEKLRKKWENGEYIGTASTLVNGFGDFVVAESFARFWPKAVNSILALDVVNKLYLMGTKGENMLSPFFGSGSIPSIPIFLDPKTGMVIAKPTVPVVPNENGGFDAAK